MKSLEEKEKIEKNDIDLIATEIKQILGKSKKTDKRINLASWFLTIGIIIGYISAIVIIALKV